MASRSYTFDKALDLKEPGVINGNGTTQINGQDQTIDLGSTTATFSGVVLFDISEIDIGNGDEAYVFVLEGSNTDDFADREQLAIKEFGAQAALTSGTKTTTPGRYEVPFFNEQDGAKYQFLRLRYFTEGQADPGINCTARIARASGMMP